MNKLGRIVFICIIDVIIAMISYKLEGRPSAIIFSGGVLAGVLTYIILEE